MKTYRRIKTTTYNMNRKRVGKLSSIFTTVLNDDYTIFKELISYEQCDLNQTEIIKEKEYTLIEFIVSENRKEMLRLLLDIDKKRINISSSLLNYSTKTVLDVMLLHDDRVDPHYQENENKKPYIIDMIHRKESSKIIMAAFMNPNFDINFTYGTKKESVLMHFIQNYTIWVVKCTKIL